jgi:hypothetical protein
MRVIILQTLLQSLTKDQLKPAADQFAAKAEPTARDIKENIIQSAVKAVSNPNVLSFC